MLPTGVEIENLRAAYTWSREKSDPETALRLVSALQQFWLRSGRFREALAAFDGALTDMEPSPITPPVWVRGVADRCAVAVWGTVPTDLGRAQEAVAIARQLDDPALLTHALIGMRNVAVYSPEVASPTSRRRSNRARAQNDRWVLSQIFSYQAAVGVYTGDLNAARAAGEEGSSIAYESATGSPPGAAGCGWAQRWECPEIFKAPPRSSDLLSMRLRNPKTSR